MKSGCALKKVKSSCIYCSPHFLLSEKKYSLTLRL